MAKLFTPESFENHFSRQVKNCTHAGVKIVAERPRGGMAEVTYIEHIHNGAELLSYYSKSVFIMENNGWKILKEHREICKNAISVNI